MRSTILDRFFGGARSTRFSREPLGVVVPTGNCLEATPPPPTARVLAAGGVLQLKQRRRRFGGSSLPPCWRWTMRSTYGLETEGFPSWRTDFAGDLSCNSPVEAVASRSWPFSTTTTASAALARLGVAAMSTAPRLPNAGEPTRGFGAAPPPAVRSSSSRGHAIARPAARLAGSGSIAPAWPSARADPERKPRPREVARWPRLQSGFADLEGLRRSLSRAEDQRSRRGWRTRGLRARCPYGFAAG
jgi:hypothetical protein